MIGLESPVVAELCVSHRSCLSMFYCRLCPPLVYAGQWQAESTLFTWLFPSLPFSVSLSLCLSMSVSVFLTPCLRFSLSLSFSFCLYFSDSLSLYLSLSLFVSVSLCLFVYLSVSESFSHCVSVSLSPFCSGCAPPTLLRDTLIMEGAGCS